MGESWTTLAAIRAKFVPLNLVLSSLTLAFVSGGCGDAGEAARTRTEPDTQTASGAGISAREDDRVARVLGLCESAGLYERNVADVHALLLDKLDTGAREPLKRAQEELGAMGDDSIGDLRRRFERDFASADLAPRLKSTLTAIGLNPSDDATRLLVAALGHPITEVRTQAALALKPRELSAEYFEPVSSAVYFQSGPSQAAGVTAMHRCDATRARAEFLDWLEAGRFKPMEPVFLPLLADCVEPEVVERARALYPTLLPRVGVYLAAGVVANEPDAAAPREWLLDVLGSEKVAERMAAVQACAAAGLFEFVMASSRADDDARVRLLANTALAASLEPDAVDNVAQATDEQREALLNALREALSDGATEVRNNALASLIGLGDERALDQAVDMLDGGRGELNLVLLPLRLRMRVDDALADRVLARVLGRLERDAGRSLKDNIDVLVALGQVPRREAAERLIELGRGSDEILNSDRAHRFLATQAANTGESGRSYLAEQLALETDQARRLDLIWALAAERDDVARAALMREFARDDVDPFELVYVADLLANLGPTESVVGLIKRRALSVEGEARTGMWCVLKRWF